MDFSNPNAEKSAFCSTSRKFGRTIVWLKGNTRDQTRFDLAFNRSINLTLEWREPFECASVCDRLIDVRLLDC